MSLCLLLGLVVWPALADTLSGRDVRVVDGDTIYILDSNKRQHKTRMQGIDAPERGQLYGKRSREDLASYVAGENVVIEYDKYDSYGRIVGKVLLSNQHIPMRLCLTEANSDLNGGNATLQPRQITTSPNLLVVL